MIRWRRRIGGGVGDGGGSVNGHKLTVVYLLSSSEYTPRHLNLHPSRTRPLSRTTLPDQRKRLACHEGTAKAPTAAPGLPKKGK